MAHAIASSLDGLSVGLVVSTESDAILRTCLYSIEEALNFENKIRSPVFEFIVVQASISKINFEKICFQFPKTSCGLRLFRSETNNLSANRQIVLSKAQTANVLFLDPDCTIDKNLFQKLAENFSKRDLYFGLAPNIRNVAKDPQIESYFRQVENSSILTLGSNQILKRHKDTPVQHSPTCGILYFTDQILNEKFDPKFRRVGEDLEFNYRLNRKTGKKILRLAGTGIDHWNSDNCTQFLNRSLRYGYAQMDIVLKTGVIYPSARLIFGLFWIPILLLSLGAFFWPSVFVLSLTAGLAVAKSHFSRGYRAVEFLGTLAALSVVYSLGVYISILVNMRLLSEKFVFERMANNEL